MATHTAWPVLTDISLVAGSMGITLGTATMSTAFQQYQLDAVIEAINQGTRRTWITATEDRYFDGSGSGQLEIDEYVTISTVQLVGWFGVTAGLALQNVVEVSKNQFPKTRIQIFRGSIPAFYNVWVDRFPVGRSNILINALWGYANTIPNDLWWGAAYQAAAVLINLSLFKTDGFLIKWQEADVTEVRNYMDPFKFFKSGKTFESLIKFYKKPSSFFFDKQTRRLV